MLSCVIYYLKIRRELSYIWSEWLLVNVGRPCVCDRHEDRVRFEADSAIVVRANVIWAWQ